MATKELTYKITTDSKQAIAGIKQFGTAVKKEMKGAEDALDDTRTAGQKAADALSKMADKMEADLKASSEAADALGTALGDTAAKLDVNKTVADLNKMGLSFDEIKADADALADAIKKIDDVNVGDTGIKDVGDDADHAKTQVHELGNESDQTKSVMANMAGNASQDLGELGGIAGTAGVAIGQLAEYATEGNISLKNLAGLAAPMLGLALATKAVGDYMEGIKAEKTFRADLVKKFVDGMREGQTAMRTINDEIETTGKLMANVSGSGGFLGLKGQAVDLVGIYAGLGKTYKDLMADLTDPTAVDRYNQLWLDNAMTDKGKIFHDIADGLADYQDSMGIATMNQDEFNKFMGDTTLALQKEANAARLAGDAVDGASNFFAQTATAQQNAADAAEAHATAEENVAAAATEVADAMLDLVDGFTNSADAQIDAADAAADYAASLKDGNKSADENRDAAIKSAKANQAWAESLAQATGKTLTATDKVDTLNDSLIDNAAQAKGPSRQAILDYVSSLNGIPPEKRTEIEAAIKAGDLETAKRLLDEASVPRYAAVIADAETATANAALDQAAKDRTATITGKVILPNGWTLDKYGTVHGPGNITLNSMPIPPTAPTAPIGPTQHAGSAVPAGGTSNFRVTINTRANGRDTVRELDQWARVNGGRRR